MADAIDVAGQAHALGNIVAETREVDHIAARAQNRRLLDPRPERRTTTVRAGLSRAVESGKRLQRERLIGFARSALPPLAQLGCSR